MMLYFYAFDILQLLVVSYHSVPLFLNLDNLKRCWLQLPEFPIQKKIRNSPMMSRRRKKYKMKNNLEELISQIFEFIRVGAIQISRGYYSKYRHRNKDGVLPKAW